MNEASPGLVATLEFEGHHAIEAFPPARGQHAMPGVKEMKSRLSLREVKSAIAPLISGNP